jgi:hypothetical protein
VIEVTPHRRRREDRSGDPLAGLVNLFDLGIVLSVAFLLAALSSLHLAGTIIHRGLRSGAPSTIVIAPGSRVAPLPAPGAQTIGAGVQVGVVYRLADGRLVFVQGPPASPGTARTPPATTGTTTGTTTTPRTHSGTTPTGTHTTPTTSTAPGTGGVSPGTGGVSPGAGGGSPQTH